MIGCVFSALKSSLFVIRVLFLGCGWVGLTGWAAAAEDPCRLLTLAEVQAVRPEILQGQLESACCIPDVRSCTWTDDRERIRMLVIMVQSPQESLPAWLKRIGLLYEGVRYVTIGGIGDQAGATIDRSPAGSRKREEITSMGAKRGRDLVMILLFSLPGNEHSPVFRRLKKILPKALDRLDP
jgi:hypothetical protein